MYIHLFGMCNMNREKVKEKLIKIKALADSVDYPEKTSVLEMYNRLLEKYSIDSNDIIEEKLTRRYFKYNNYIDRALLTQIFYMVTGDDKYYMFKDKRKREVSLDCTDLEYEEIKFYYDFYARHMAEELDIFIAAFVNSNNLFPNSSARMYKENDIDFDKLDLERLERISNMAGDIRKKSPAKQTEQKGENE